MRGGCDEQNYQIQMKELTNLGGVLPMIMSRGASCSNSAVLLLDREPSLETEADGEDIACGVSIAYGET